MIIIYLGRMGSGKTSSCVRDIINNEEDKITFSNIIIKKKNKNVIQINRGMIIKKDVVGYTREGKEKAVLSLNSDFWKEQREKYKSLNVVLDEAHAIGFESRRSMSKENLILNDFVALLRRILGEAEGSSGNLILITQLGNRLDNRLRELANNVIYHKCHYQRICKNCGLIIHESNEDLNTYKTCPNCNYNKFEKKNYIIERWEFANTDYCNEWLERKTKTYHKHYFITDIETSAFPFYDTYQWDNLISEY